MTAKKTSARKSAPKTPRRTARKTLARKAAKTAPRKRKTAKKAMQRSFTGLWVPGIAGGVFALAVGVWYMQKPLSVPAPVQGGVSVVANPVTVVMEEKPAQGASQPEAQGQAQPQAQTQAPPPAPARAAHALDPEFEKARALPLGERIAYWSGMVVADPKKSGEIFKALGKGPAIADSAPFFPSKYDCTTFVETVSSLARTRTPEDFFKNLVAVRYREGRTDYFGRNHFPEADWIPNNEKAGILKDATAEIAAKVGIEARTLAKTIDRGKWLKAQVRSGSASRAIASAADPAWASPVEVKLPYVEVSRLDRIANALPHGAILNFVRSSEPSKPVVITHQGFVIRENGKVMLRHSSSGGVLRTVDLRDYVAKQLNERGWKLVGFNVNLLGE